MCNIELSSPLPPGALHQPVLLPFCSYVLHVPFVTGESRVLDCWWDQVPASSSLEGARSALHVPVPAITICIRFSRLLMQLEAEVTMKLYS